MADWHTSEFYLKQTGQGRWSGRICVLLGESDSGPSAESRQL